MVHVYLSTSDHKITSITYPTGNTKKPRNNPKMKMHRNHDKQLPRYHGHSRGTSTRFCRFQASLSRILFHIDYDCCHPDHPWHKHPASRPTKSSLVSNASRYFKPQNSQVYPPSNKWFHAFYEPTEQTDDKNLQEDTSKC